MRVEIPAPRPQRRPQCRVAPTARSCSTGGRRGRSAPNGSGPAGAPGAGEGGAAPSHHHHLESRDDFEDGDDRRRIENAEHGADLLGITLLDHLILTEDRLYSFADQGWPCT